MKNTMPLYDFKLPIKFYIEEQRVLCSFRINENCVITKPFTLSEFTNIGSHPDSIIDPHHIAIQLTHSNHMQHEWNNRSTDKHGLPHRYFPYVVAMPEELNFHTILRPQHEHILSDGRIDIQKFKEVITGWKKSLK